MTADEIRNSYNNAHADLRPDWEIALQLALSNERLERIATALETAKNVPRPEPRYALDCVPVPKGWRRIGFREPVFGEYFMSDTGGVGYQDGGVSFAGRDPIHIIVERWEDVL